MGARVLVLGATGQVGGTLVGELARRGIEVTAATRDPSRSQWSSGVRVARFDYADPSTYYGAVAGADRLFVMSPPGVAAVDRLVGPFFSRALPQFRHVVLMTAAGVETNEQIPLRKLELQLEGSGVGWTHLRPSWFMQNFHTFWKPGIDATGSILVPAGDAKTALIDARDIGEVAAAVLSENNHVGKAYTLTGPSALSYHEAAAILSHETGRQIGYQSIDDATFSASLVQAGLPRDYSELLVGMFGAVRAGFASTVTDAVPRLLGRPARTLAEYAADARALLSAR